MTSKGIGMARSATLSVRFTRKRLADGSVAVYAYDRASGARLSDAELAERQVVRAHAAKTAPAPRPPTVVQRMAPLLDTPEALLGDIIRAYEHSPQYQMLAPPTQFNYSRAFGHPLLTPYLRVRCDDIRPKHISNLIDQIAQGGIEARGRMATGMANTVLAALRVVARWGRLRCDLRGDFTADVPFFAVQEGHLPWSNAELTAFMAAAPEPYRRAVALGLWTAQRVGDLVALRWDQWDGRTLTMVARKTRRKVREALMIPLSPDANRALAEWKRSSTTLTILATGAGKPWADGKHLGQCLWEIRKTHKLAPRTMHGLRVTAASRLIEAGLPTRDVMALTGHKDERTFNAYVRKADQGVRVERAAAAWALVSPLPNFDIGGGSL